MLAINPLNKRSPEPGASQSKKIKPSLPQFDELDQPVMSHIACFLPLMTRSVLSQSCKRWYEGISIYHARELGYKGSDLAGAKRKIDNLCQRILIFQEQDQTIAFGHGLHRLFYQNQPRMDPKNPPPLVPQFPYKSNPQDNKPRFPHPLELLFDICKNWDLNKICTWFLLNPSYYISQETPWIDFFEVESSWSQVPQRSTRSDEETMLYHALSLAYYFKRPQLIQILVDRGAPLDKLAYMRACRDPFDPNAFLASPLRSAIAHGDQKQIEFLHSKGVKVKSADLRFAIDTQESSVNIPLLKFLLPLCKKPIDYFDLWDRSGIWGQAVLIESQEAIELFMQQGCKIDPRDAPTLMCEFIQKRISTQKGCNDPFAEFYLNLLLENKADLNGYCRSEHGKMGKRHTLLQAAIMKKSLEWTRWLLEKGAKADKPDDFDFSLLAELCCNAHPSPLDLDLIRLLLSYEANPLLLGKLSRPYRCAQNFNAQEIVRIFDEHIRRHGMDGHQG